MAAEVTDYCTKHSTGVPKDMAQVYDWTEKELQEADKMSSPLQGMTNKFFAEMVQAKRSIARRLAGNRL